MFSSFSFALSIYYLSIYLMCEPFFRFSSPPPLIPYILIFFYCSSHTLSLSLYYFLSLPFFPISSTAISLALPYVCVLYYLCISLSSFLSLSIPRGKNGSYTMYFIHTSDTWLIPTASLLSTLSYRFRISLNWKRFVIPNIWTLDTQLR